MQLQIVVEKLDGEALKCDISEDALTTRARLLSLSMGERFPFVGIFDLDNQIVYQKIPTASTTPSEFRYTRSGYSSYLVL
jgi:hypothetical protein